MRRLPASIQAVFKAAGGRLTFARFMELALTDPQAGYYTAAERRVGLEGDFTTAPRRVPEFNQALARLLAGLADSLGEAGWEGRLLLVEVGPGEGDLIHGVLTSWESERPDLRDKVACRLVEVGEGLRARQKERLADLLARGWDVAWSKDIQGEKGSAGLVVSNELLDALPIHRVSVSAGEPREAWVGLEAAGGEAALVEEWGELSEDAGGELGRLFGATDTAGLRRLTRDGELELRPAVGEYVRAVASAFEVACLVTVDYGDWLAGPDGSSDAGLCPPAFAEAGCGESHWAAPLHGRSLRSYYRHQRGHDPYQAVGRQDLTADVDFRALALHGREYGFDCLVYTSLARLLCGMGELGAQIPAPAGGLDYSLEDDMEQAPLHALRDEEGLGGLFKIMVQVKEEEPRQE